MKSGEPPLLESLAAYREMLKRAEDRMELSETRAEYKANEEIANYAAHRINDILRKLHNW